MFFARALVLAALVTCAGGPVTSSRSRSTSTRAIDGIAQQPFGTVRPAVLGGAQVGIRETVLESATGRAERTCADGFGGVAPLRSGGPALAGAWYLVAVV